VAALSFSHLVFIFGMRKIILIAFAVCLVAIVSCDKDKEEAKVTCEFDSISPDYSGLVGTWELSNYMYGGTGPQTDLTCSLVPGDLRSFVGMEMTITQGDYFNAHIVLCDNEENLTGVAKEIINDGGSVQRIRAMFYDENCHPIREFNYTYWQDDLIIDYTIFEKGLFLTYRRK
jgi:hypothetical protein